MALTKVLIAVKTYPSLSTKYDELVCTAGFREDGSWIRIYPVPFRKLDYDKQYPKWAWIELDLDRNTRDLRSESYRPHDIDEEIRILEQIGTGPEGWRRRKQIALHSVWTNMSDLIAASKVEPIYTSLAVLKPREILRFEWEETAREWDKEKLDAIYARQQELNLFEETKKIFKVARKVPYKFFYVFTTDDGIERRLMIEDWEIGMLYWNTVKRADGDEVIACQKVKERYFDDFAKRKDLYLFLGTSLSYHLRSKNPFMIIGVFPPPILPPEEPTLF